MKKLILPLAVLISTAAVAQQPSGEQLFKQKCATCHTIAPDGKELMGPNLLGVMGRKAGAGGYKYSPALKASDITWNAQTLNTFLAAPTKTVPGTRMMLPTPQAPQRAAIIAYLETLKR